MDNNDNSSIMIHQNQIRFWWIVSVVIVGGCESLALLTSKTLRSVVYHRLPGETSGRHLSPLRASSPVYYREQPQRHVVVDNPLITKTSTLEDDDSLSTTLSIPLINYICVNQTILFLVASSIALIASLFGDNPLEISALHWNNIQDFHLLFDWQPSTFRLTEGIFAAIPLIGLGRLIETSDNRDASMMNFDTTNMVISLFGRRKSVIEPTASASFQVMVLSAMIAISSGISEEIIFRGYIPTAISSTTHSLPLALFGQGALFAIGHLSKNAHPGENKMNASIQSLIGLWYGAVYLVTGGDILPCILAHVLYDMHTLCETWTQVNNQMDYTQESSMKCFDEEEIHAAKRLESETGIKLNIETVNFARHFFYAFDNSHVGSLSLSDCQRAVSYAFMNDKITPDPEVVIDLFQQAKDRRHADDRVVVELRDRLDFSEFLHVLFVLRSNSRAYSR